MMIAGSVRHRCMFASRLITALSSGVRSMATAIPKQKSENVERRPSSGPRSSRQYIYGVHPVSLCLSSANRKIHKLYVKKNRMDDPAVLNIVSTAERRKVDIKEVFGYRLNMLCSMSQPEGFERKIPHQGVVLETSPLNVPQWNDDMNLYAEAIGEIPQADDKAKLAVYLDRVQDPMNMGAIIRTCVFLGVDMVFVPERDSCKLGAAVSKASSGALEVVNIRYVEKPDVFFGFLKKIHWDIVGTDAECKPYFHIGSNSSKEGFRNRLIVLGNEHSGVDDSMRRFFTTSISIPSFNPKVSSLNVSVTAGVLLSHFRK